eukprot:scaffold7945_cov183-Alexandrium_tamarense.AAC.1
MKVAPGKALDNRKTAYYRSCWLVCVKWNGFVGRSARLRRGRLSFFCGCWQVSSEGQTTKDRFNTR